MPTGTPELRVNTAGTDTMCRVSRPTVKLKPSTVSRRSAVVAGFYRTCVIDAGVDLGTSRSPRHADPRTTMRYDRARKNLDRHPNDILAAYMALGT